VGHGRTSADIIDAGIAFAQPKTTTPPATSSVRTILLVDWLKLFQTKVALLFHKSPC
jgi:hypothetical protein